MRGLLRAAKARALRFRRAASPILVMGLRRGGSTMVADAVAANAGVWLVNEPFAVLPTHPGHALKSARLPAAAHSQFFALRGADLARFDAYLDDLLAARLRALGAARRARAPLTADRVCLKILNAPWMIERMIGRDGAQALILLRHPGAQALSALRQGWGFALEAYHARRDALDAAFDADQLALWDDVAASGDRWRIAVLDWVIASLPLRRCAAPGARRVLYEDVVAAPDRFVDETLSDWLGLAERDRMRAALSRPSGSSRMSEKAALDAMRDRDVAALVDGWRDKLDADQRRAGQEILDVFRVAHYQF